MDGILIAIILMLSFFAWWRMGTRRRERERLLVEHAGILQQIQNDPDNDAALEALGDWLVKNGRLGEAVTLYENAIAVSHKHSSDVSGESRLNAKIRNLQRDIVQLQTQKKRWFSKKAPLPKIRDVDICPTCGASNMLGATVCDTCGQLMLADNLWISVQNMWEHTESRKAFYETIAIIAVISIIIATFDFIPTDFKGPILASTILVLGYRFLWSVNGYR